MNESLLKAYDALPFPDRSSLNFHAMLRHLPLRDFSRVNPGQFNSGIALHQAESIPATALASLKRALASANIAINEDGIPLDVKINTAYQNEEYELEIGENSVILTASGENGLRYAVYEFEDALLAHDTDGTIVKCVHRIPQVKHRITRSFLTPNTRPPLRLDELEDDFDYYPDEYLDAIAHERLNGIWITIYLNDMPCHYFPERGSSADAKLAKLRTIIAKCARYGIKCYLYMSEPRAFDDGWKNMSRQNLEAYPDMAGHISRNGTPFFCTTSEDGRGYIQETLGYVAKNTPGLGGIINIMCGETTRTCSLWKVFPQVEECNCPRCSKYDVGELFASFARLMNDTLHKYQPEALFIGWFYAGTYLPGDADVKMFIEVAKSWPKDIPLMRNCETGGLVEQLGRKSYVQDYSLSYSHASEPWKEFASHLEMPAAKIQTCTSHEDATVPYLPVPGCLYSTYRDLHEARCSSVMQCWYFGNYPSLMNVAAGRLSFKPFPPSEMEFLKELAAPVWGSHAEEAALCWQKFTRAYQKFPETLGFKWFGPLHSSIVFPWYLEPRDLPMAPSYTQAFPKNSGDRIYECIGYVHTPETALTLMNQMNEEWQAALAQLSKIASTDEQLVELNIAEAVGIQISSTCNLLQFYSIRENMIFHGTKRMDEICALIRAEIENTLRMKVLCEANEQLGYHAEVESYMFYPQKLAMRATLLQNLLATECSNFDVQSPQMRLYRGELPEATDIRLDEPFYVDGVELCWRRESAEKLILDCKGNMKKFTLYLEPGRLCRIICIGVDSSYYIHNGTTEGIELIHEEPEHAQFVVDMEFFAEYRQRKNQPLRFNVSNGNGALHELHPYPGRLIMGNANPADLVKLLIE